MRRIAGWACTLATALVAAPAEAQPATVEEGVQLWGWSFRPALEVRVRGEYRNQPVDVGGNVYRSSAVLGDGLGLSTPQVAYGTAPVEHSWSIAERTRLGLSAARGPVTALVSLQDSRLWGTAPDALAAGGDELPIFAPWEAYVDVHARSGRRMFLRIGRQRVVWGDGRLVGDSDWSATPRSLDAARFGVQIGDIDLEAMAAVLAMPGAARPNPTAEAPTADTTRAEGSGAQLYGLDAVWRFVPLFNVEGTFLARVVREPRPSWLVPSDTLVGDARVFGDHRGFRYALEGAYQGGRVASFGDNRTLAAFALAGRVELETALPWQPTFGVAGSFASGDDGPGTAEDTLTRFDPILPEAHDVMAPMDLWAWSNAITAGATVSARPRDILTARLAYQLALLAEPGGRWTTAALSPVGAAPDNTSRALGHQLSLGLGVTPWDPIRFDAGYGLTLFGDGAKAILASARRCEPTATACDAPSAQHWAYLQTTVRVP
jgi:hypothetical protein